LQRQGRQQQPCQAALPCCKRHYEPSAIEYSTQWQCILKTCKTKQVCMLSTCFYILCTSLSVARAAYQCNAGSVNVLAVKCCRLGDECRCQGSCAAGQSLLQVTSLLYIPWAACGQVRVCRLPELAYSFYTNLIEKQQMVQTSDGLLKAMSLQEQLLSSVNAAAHTAQAACHDSLLLRSCCPACSLQMYCHMYLDVLFTPCSFVGFAVLPIVYCAA